MNGLKQVFVSRTVPNANFKELYSCGFSHEKCAYDQYMLLYTTTLVPAIKYINGFIDTYCILLRCDNIIKQFSLSKVFW